MCALFVLGILVSCHAVSAICKIDAENPWGNHEKMHLGDSKSINNRLNKKTTLAAAGDLSKLVQTKGGAVFEERVPFWRHLAYFGCYFGPSWIPKGSQNHCVGHYLGKMMKKVVQKRHLKTHQKLIPKWVS